MKLKCQCRMAWPVKVLEASGANPVGRSWKAILPDVIVADYRIGCCTKGLMSLITYLYLPPTIWCYQIRNCRNLEKVPTVESTARKYEKHEGKTTRMDEESKKITIAIWTYRGTRKSNRLLWHAKYGKRNAQEFEKPGSLPINPLFRSIN